MSDVQRVLPSAKDLKARAAQWFERRNFWKWDEGDEAAFVEWLNESLAHRAAYVRVEAAWKRTERLSALRAATHAQTQTGSRSRFRLLFLRAASAVVAVGVLGTGLVWMRSGPADQVYTTAVGGRETLTLADGSKIELNTDTVLRAKITALDRNIWLDKGEAYFQVKHDAIHPFVVFAGNHRVTDIGTGFLIRKDETKVEVALVEGRAQLDALDSQAHAPSIQMMPGDVVVASGNHTEIEKKPVADLSNILSWRRGLLVFKHTTLADAAVEFNRYNSKKLVIADMAAARLQIGGTFQSDNIGDFAEVAREVLGVHVQHRGDETVISR
jgi:transmembrane sensor